MDPVTGGVYRQFSHMTQVEKSKTTVEFVDDVVTAIEESEDRRGGNVRVIVAPLRFGWRAFPGAATALRAALGSGRSVWRPSFAEGWPNMNPRRR